MENIIQKVKTNNSYPSSTTWSKFTEHLESYLINGDMDLFLINHIEPHIFIWPMDSIQNK
jgi:hypothetical protein